MKKLFLLFAMLCCIQLGANAQTSKEAIPQNIITNLSKQIKEDLPNRMKVLKESVELKAALLEKFGERFDLTSDKVIIFLINEAKPSNKNFSRMTGAMKLVYGGIEGPVLDPNRLEKKK